MNKKQTLLFIIIFLLAGNFAYSEMMITTGPETISSSRISIPLEVRDYASEKDLIEALCYEAKWKGGEGVAKIEALEEIVSPALDSVIEMGIDFGGIDLKGEALEARQRLDFVCTASDVEEASQRINDYISFSENLRIKLEGEFSSNLRGMEDELRKKGEEIKNKLEAELGEESERLAKEAEDVLRKAGEEEGRALEAQLRQLGSEFESFMSRGDVGFGEARAKANELAGRVSAEPATISFLSSKFQELLSEASGLVSRAMSGEITPDQIISMINQRVPSVVEEIKSFMKQSYEEKAKEEEARIRSELEEKANEIAGESKENLEKIRDHFENFEEKLEVLSQQKMSEWAGYEEKAQEKKREIIIKSVDGHFDKAKKLIEERKDQIDMAVEEGVAEEYGIISYQSLMAEIDRDRNEIINRFVSADFDPVAIASVQAEFQKKWNDYRLKMEAIEVVSAEEAVQKVLQATDWKGVLSRTRNAISEMERRDSGRANLEKYLAECSNDPSMYDPPEITGGRKIYISNNCIHCRTLEEARALVEAAEKINISNLENSQEVIRSHIWRLENSPENLTLRDVLRMKNELMEAVESFVGIESSMVNAQNKHNEAREAARNICIVYTEERDTPNPPTLAPNIECRVASTGQINVSWNSISGSNSYYVYRCAGTNCSPRKLVRDQAGTMWSDRMRISPGIDYNYRVRAKNAGGFGPYSEIVTCNTAK